MIPEGEKPPAGFAEGKNVSHAQREGRSSAGAIEQGLLTDVVRERLHLARGYREAPVCDGRCRGISGRPDHTRRCVDGEKHARLQRAGGDQRHNRHETLEQHGAVAHTGCVAFPGEQFRSGSRGNERVKTGNRAASDGDKAKGEHFAGENGSGAVHEPGQSRELQLRPDKKNPHTQHQHDAKLDECTQIAARREQQPYRQRARKESVADECGGERHAGVGEPRCARRRLRHNLAAEDAGHNQDETHDGALEHLARPPVPEIQAHYDSDRHRGGDRERSPWAALERVHDH